MIASRQTLLQLFVVMLLITACGGGEEEALPTAVEFPAEVAPTETVTVEMTATPTQVSNPTLPPTWTFTPEPSVTPTPTNTSTPLPTPRTVAEVCDSFAADPVRSTREFIPGEAPVAAWTAVEGAELYRVFLSTLSQRLIRDDIYVAETSFTFDPNSFEFGEIYIWAVWPLDSVGDQMCFERGGELIPQRPPVGGGD